MTSTHARILASRWVGRPSRNRLSQVAHLIGAALLIGGLSGRMEQHAWQETLGMAVVVGVWAAVFPLLMLRSLQAVVVEAQSGEGR